MVEVYLAGSELRVFFVSKAVYCFVIALHLSWSTGMRENTIRESLKCHGVLAPTVLLSQWFTAGRNVLSLQRQVKPALQQGGAIFEDMSRKQRAKTADTSYLPRLC